MLNAQGKPVMNHEQWAKFRKAKTHHEQTTLMFGWIKAGAIPKMTFGAMLHESFCDTFNLGHEAGVASVKRDKILK